MDLRRLTDQVRQAVRDRKAQVDRVSAENQAHRQQLPDLGAIDSKVDSAVVSDLRDAVTELAATLDHRKSAARANLMRASASLND